MKTIGLIGGMSWESTVTYYQIINETIKRELGGLHSAKILLYSVDFDEIEKYQSSGEWDKAAEILADTAEKLQNAGAECIIICTNTMHKIAPQIKHRVSVPLIHIAEATAEVLRQNGVKKVGLLGTKYTMTQNFYKSKLTDTGLDVLIPDEQDIEMINNVIFNELCLGIISSQSREKFITVINKLADKGAEGVILGCTEIGLLINPSDITLPCFDTTQIHAEKAALWAIGK